MSFSIEQVQKLAKLARMRLTDEEARNMQRDLSQIVGYVEQLAGVDVNDVEAMTHAIPMELYQRKDEVLDVVGREGIMGSKGYDEGLVRVPKIIE